MKRTKTFTVEYTYFEPGTKVQVVGQILGMEEGKTYVVESCHEPVHAGDEPLVFIEGFPLGFCPDRFREVE